MKLPLLVCYLPMRAIVAPAALAVGVAGVMFGVDKILARAPSSLMTILVALGLVMGWMMGGLFLPTSSKSSEFEAALPVAASDIALTKSIAMAILWLAPVWTVFATALALSASRGLAGQVVARGLALTLSVSGCVLLAAVIRYRAPRTEPSRLQSLARGWVIAAVVLAGFLFPFAAVGGVALLLAAIAAGPSYPSVPAPRHLPIASAKTTASNKARVQTGTVGAQQNVREDGHGAFAIGDALRHLQAAEKPSYSVRRLLIKHCLLSRLPLMALLLLSFVGFAHFETGSTVSIAMALLVIALARSSLQALHVLSHLPVRRRRVLVYVVVPPIAALLLGLTIAWSIDSDRRVVEFDRKRDNRNSRKVAGFELIVPPSMWKIGKPPLVTAPNGESLTPTAHSIGPLTVYNPYEVGYKPGHEFFVFQLSRVLHDCCGLQLTSQQVLLRYLSNKNKNWYYGLSSRDYPELRKPRSLTDLLFNAVLVTMFSLVILSTVVYRNRPWASATAVLRHGVLVWGPTGVILVGSMLAHFNKRGIVFFRDVARLAGAAWSSIVVDNRLGVIPIALIIIAVVYLALQRRFQHMEPPSPITGKKLGSRLVEV